MDCPSGGSGRGVVHGRVCHTLECFSTPYSRLLTYNLVFHPGWHPSSGNFPRRRCARRSHWTRKGKSSIEAVIFYLHQTALLCSWLSIPWHFSLLGPYIKLSERPVYLRLYLLTYTPTIARTNWQCSPIDLEIWRLVFMFSLPSILFIWISLATFQRIYVIALLVVLCSGNR